MKVCGLLLREPLRLRFPAWLMTALVLASTPPRADDTGVAPGVTALSTTAVRPAGLHEWRDAQGYLHRSNLPPQAFAADGRPRPAWDPNHPASQQAALMHRLAEREQALRRQREARALAGTGAAEEAARSGDGPAAMPSRRMGVDDLLGIEKNAGRPVPTAP